MDPMVHAVLMSELRLWDRWRMQSVCPSFTFVIDGAYSLSVLALPLGLMAHVVNVFWA